ncbi:MAG: type II toxin-antitoxin system VapB family antitoxin [bacterium]
MRTYINIEENIIREAQTISNIKNKRELFLIALKEFINSRKALNIRDLKGKIEFLDNYNYKAMRKNGSS